MSTPFNVNIACVGLTLVDMVTVVERYPEEDSDQRGVSFRKQRGGNASNTCTVLSLLNTPCEYLGVLPPPADPEHRWLMDDFDRHGINIQNSVFSDRPCPVANVVVSRHTGTRTIIFCDNGHPELSHQHFVTAVQGRLPLFSWIHFELRSNVEDCLHMLETVAEYRKATFEADKTKPSATPSVSVEIEKPDLVNPECLMRLADVIFISKDWAQSRGWTDMCSAVKSASQLCRPDCTVICPWAEEGAAAWHDGAVITAFFKPADQVVDTLGAGDTFVAGFLHARSRQMAVQQALDFACQLAATKCTMAGFSGLKTFAEKNISNP